MCICRMMWMNCICSAFLELCSNDFSFIIILCVCVCVYTAVRKECVPQVLLPEEEKIIVEEMKSNGQTVIEEK